MNRRPTIITVIDAVHQWVVFAVCAPAPAILGAITHLWVIAIRLIRQIGRPPH